jgi:hypothetical protein
MKTCPTLILECNTSTSALLIKNAITKKMDVRSVKLMWRFYFNCIAPILRGSRSGTSDVKTTDQQCFLPPSSTVYALFSLFLIHPYFPSPTLLYSLTSLVFLIFRLHLSVILSSVLLQIHLPLSFSLFSSSFSAYHFLPPSLVTRNTGLAFCKGQTKPQTHAGALV